MKIAMTSVFVADPVTAHAFYTNVLGFQSHHFDAQSQLAIVVSSEDPGGTQLLLEPRGDSFAKTYQLALFEAGLPAIVFEVSDLAATVERMRGDGVVFRGDLDKPAWGLENLFEDSCGNLLMLQAAPRAGDSV